MANMVDISIEDIWCSMTYTIRMRSTYDFKEEKLRVYLSKVLNGGIEIYKWDSEGDEYDYDVTFTCVDKNGNQRSAKDIVIWMKELEERIRTAKAQWDLLSMLVNE